MLKVHARRFGTVAVVGLEGQIVNGQTEILRNVVQSLTNVSAIKLDLARIATIDAGGLGVMLELREQADKKGIRFELMNLSQQIRRVFEITRLDTVFRITSALELFPPVTRSSRSPVARLASCA